MELKNFFKTNFQGVGKTEKRIYKDTKRGKELFEFIFSKHITSGFDTNSDFVEFDFYGNRIKGFFCVFNSFWHFVTLTKDGLQIFTPLQLLQHIYNFDENINAISPVKMDIKLLGEWRKLILNNKKNKIRNDK